MKKQKKEKKNLFFKKLLQSIKEDQIPLLSAQTTYHFIMSLVPFLIVLLNIVLMVAASKLDLIFKWMEVIPSETRNILMTLINTIISNRSSSVLSISLLVALWSSSKALKLNNTQTRFVMFYGENHELSRSGKPKNRIRRLKEICDWFDIYLR